MINIIAHRGASSIAPENTMPAFQHAYELGVEGIETDVHLTKDSVPVLIHDERVERTTNGFGYVKDFTFQQLKQLDAGAWFSIAFSHTPIISLDEFLAWAQFKPLHLHIELKNNKINYKHLEEIVFEMVSYYRLQEQTTLSTFNCHSIKRLSMFKDDINIALLTSKQRQNLCAYTYELGARALHIKYPLLQQQLINQCQSKHIPIRVFTVNTLAHMLQCFRQKCDGIFTDFPKKAIQYRKDFYKI